MIFHTERMQLRPWTEADAQVLFQYASDPRIGPMAGWPVHTSIDNSRQIICDVLSAPEVYALVLHGEHSPIGSIGLIMIQENEGEIGYWIAVPYWGQGLVLEAVRELLRHGFQDLDLNVIWCAYYDGNEKSKRVQEKCGFLYHHTVYDKPCPLINETRTEHFSCITKDQWEQTQKNEG